MQFYKDTKKTMIFTRNEILDMLCVEGAEVQSLLARAHEVRVAASGPKVFPRGLIEYSNRCRKNCLYCGIRRGMAGVERFTLTPEEVLGAAREAMHRGYGSVVLQAGELTSRSHIATIEDLVRQIAAITPESAGVPPSMSTGWDRSLGITLSLGEQSVETYRRWREAGATRYLLRIEASDPALYRHLHPGTPLHSYSRRVEALNALREAGFMVGTGVMIGVPRQTIENLADDLLFMQGVGIDMCGMGPYVECVGTPFAGLPVPLTEWRIDMTLKMIAVLRLMMPDINIAAATALETLSPDGRRRALAGGANVLMPNLTPEAGRGYRLYDNKPVPGKVPFDGLDLEIGRHGDPIHFKCR